MNFLLAAAVHRLCLADDLTLHVTCGDITHSCERKSEYGLRARCLPSKSHRTEAETRSHRFTNNILRPFQNLLSIYFTIITHWSAPILHHCCKNSKGPQQILSAILLQNRTLLCVNNFIYVCFYSSPICFFSEVYHFLKIELPLFTQSEIHMSLLLRKML